MRLRDDLALAILSGFYPDGTPDKASYQRADKVLSLIADKVRGLVDPFRMMENPEEPIWSSAQHNFAKAVEWEKATVNKSIGFKQGIQAVLELLEVKDG